MSPKKIRFVIERRLTVCSTSGIGRILQNREAFSAFVTFQKPFLAYVSFSCVCAKQNADRCWQHNRGISDFFQVICVKYEVGTDKKGPWHSASSLKFPTVRFRKFSVTKIRHILQFAKKFQNMTKATIRIVIWNWLALKQSVTSIFSFLLLPIEHKCYADNIITKMQ